MTFKVLLLLLGALGASTTKMTLEGTLGEFVGEPVTIHCDNEKGYIRLGGITINNNPLTPQQSKQPKRQCEQQMKKVEESRKDYNPIAVGTDCVLTFPKQMQVNSTDVIRIVFKCYDFRPSGSPSWGKNKKGNKGDVKYAKKKKGSLKLECKSQAEMIFIEAVKINEVETTHPDLTVEKLTQDCFGQWIKEIEKGSGLNKPRCYIENKDEYGGEMEIKYSCIDAGKDRKEMSSKGKGRHDEKEF